MSNRKRAIPANALGKPIKFSAKANIERICPGRFAEECAKLNPKAEQALAEEGFGGIVDE
jgi:hypothetical protein